MTGPTDEGTRVADPDLDGTTDRMIGIWRTALGVDDVAPDSHLLDLGATSLSAIRIRLMVQAEFGTELELIDFFDHPTPRGLAGVVAGMLARDGSAADPPAPGGSAPDRSQS